MTERRISHYEIEKVLGEGAMGKVFRARDVNLDRPVALKFISARLDDPSFSERFKREARLAAQLNHPNIATIYEFGQENNEAYIAMEFVEGETLEDRIKRGPLAVEDVRRFGAQAAGALAAAHELEIVHRDIKPANLMITRAGAIKVMDFGVARRAGETQLTMEGALVGTANIMAPETLKGEPPTTQSDLFSLGCVLYESLVGRSPFPGDDLMAVLYQVKNEDPTSLKELRPEIPDDLVDLIEGMMRKNPLERLGPAGSIADALAGNRGAFPTSAGATMVPGGAGATMAVGGPSATAIPAGAPEEAPKRRRNPLLFGGLGALTIAVIGVLVWQLGGSGGGEREVNPEAVRLNDRAMLTWGANQTNDDSLDVVEDMLFTAAQLDPDYANPWNNLGALLRSRKKFDEARQVFGNAVGDNPKYAVARTNLGDVLYDIAMAKSPPDAQLIEQAEAEYRQAIEDAPNLLFPKNNLAYLLIHKGNELEAIDILNGAIQQFPDEASLHKNLGLAYLEMDPPKPRLAEPPLRKALEINPRYTAAQEALKRVTDLQSGG